MINITLAPPMCAMARIGMSGDEPGRPLVDRCCSRRDEWALFSLECSFASIVSCQCGNSIVLANCSRERIQVLSAWHGLAERHHVQAE
jgi:hypothetical protein